LGFGGGGGLATGSGAGGGGYSGGGSGAPGFGGGGGGSFNAGTNQINTAAATTTDGNGLVMITTVTGTEGAGKAPIGPQSANGGNCQQGSTDGNGFAVLNTPGMAEALSGEVSLKDGTPNATYYVFVDDGSVCIPEGTLTTNHAGNGNTSLSPAGLAGGSYFVVLSISSSPSDEVYASASVTLG
jgi:hypothetical protein